MKKIILLLILFSSISAFSQDSLITKKPRVFSRVVPIVEYEITHENVPAGKNQFLVTTKLFVLRQGQDFFEIFAKWENLTRQEANIEKLVKYQESLAKKELKIIGFHE